MIVNGAYCGGWLDHLDAAKNFIVLVNDSVTVNKLITQTISTIPNINLSIFKAQVQQLKKMRQHQFSYEEALALETVKELQIWFLQGRQLVKTGMLPLDIFVKIASALIPLDQNETKMLFHKYTSKVDKKWQSANASFHTSIFNFFSATLEKANQLFSQTKKNNADVNLKKILNQNEAENSKEIIALHRKRLT